MKTVLFVNGCPRKEKSRTLRLAGVFLSKLKEIMPECRITEQDLNQMKLKPVDDDTLSQREKLCDMKAFEHPSFSHVLPFQQADAVVVAAPYWDLSFPSELKVWVENIYIRNLCFRYEGSRCIGLCKGKRAIYLTTSGSPIGQNDFGASYMKAVFQSLGIPEFESVSAEGLDLWENDPEEIMRKAAGEAERAAVCLAEMLLTE